MHYRLITLIAAALAALTSCNHSDTNLEDDLDIDRSQTGFVANFSPADSIIPFPSNLLFSGSLDGTLNIPVEDENDFSDPQVALNQLDGFSTSAPISTTFNLEIDPSTLTSETIHVYEVQLSGIGGGVTGIERELGFGTEYTATLSSVDSEGKTLVILPLQPLKPLTSYLIALTTGIQSIDGRSAAPEATYVITKSTQSLLDAENNSTTNTLSNEQAIALEPLRLLVNSQEFALANAGLHSDVIALSWTFTTQSVGNVLTRVHELASTSPASSSVTPVSIGTTTSFLGPASPGIADVYIGTLTVPYYLTNADISPTAPLGTFWQGVGGSALTQFNTTPVATSDETIPLLISVPNTGGSGPWPVVIFQHGITSNRTAMLAAADSLAAAGFAAVAIDLPLHGLPPGHGLYTGIERTFDLDLVDNTTRAAGPDGVADDSGTHSINLTSLLTSRDNSRQGAADLFALFNALESMDINGDVTPDFDHDNVYFLGHSLGGMVGSLFLAHEPDVKSAVTAMPGGGIAKLLDGSPTFGPTIAAGLSAAGVEKGTADYESFMGAAQTILDSSDPLNYASATVADRGYLMFEIVGDGGDNLPDQVIPNNVFADAPEGTVPSPLAGTDPLAAVMGLTQVSTTTADSSALNAIIRFTAGDHSSILDPTANSTATTVMQTAMAGFFASDGTQIAIADESVVE